MNTRFSGAATMTNGQEHSILPLLKKAVEEMEASGLTTKGIYRPTNFPRHLYEKQSEFEDEAGTIVDNFLQTGKNKNAKLIRTYLITFS